MLYRLYHVVHDTLYTVMERDGKQLQLQPTCGKQPTLQHPACNVVIGGFKANTALPVLA